ncbi:MAG: hypothetical protein ACYC3S_09410 [Chloroflexota bacterium]
MIIGLLASTFVVSFAVATIVVLFFRRPIDAILQRVIGEDISRAWSRYLLFTIYVIGIGGGVRVFQIERYLEPNGPVGRSLALDTDRWVLEIYQTIIGTLQSIATMLLVFFLVALIALVIVRSVEARRPRA